MGNHAHFGGGVKTQVTDRFTDQFAACIAAQVSVPFPSLFPRLRTRAGYAMGLRTEVTTASLGRSLILIPNELRLLPPAWLRIIHVSGFHDHQPGR